jgi:DNA-binding CsgD family transcriptional regulator
VKWSEWSARSTRFRNEITYDSARQDPGRTETGPDGLILGEDGAYPVAEASRGGVVRDPVSKRDATSWLNWQAAFYAFVLGMMCVFLVPLTSLWWLVPVLGAAVPIVLAVLHKPNPRLEGRDDKQETGDARAPRRLEDPLSKRELEVLSLLASGRTNSEVARDLYVSVGTVKSHTGNIYRKLGAKNRAEAVARARDFDLLL